MNSSLLPKRQRTTNFKMGHSVSDLREKAKKLEQEKDKQVMEQRLDVLEKMINRRLEVEKNSILNGEKHDQEIDTGTVVFMQKMVYIQLEEKVSNTLSNAISDVFAGDLIGGIESIVKLGADVVLENDSIGEHETKDMFIVWNENALLRCDAYYYRWNFVSKSVINDTEGVTGVLLIKRVIDLTKTDPQVLTWAITNMADRLNRSDHGAKHVDPNTVIDDALKVLKRVIEFQAKVKAIEAGSKPDA